MTNKEIMEKFLERNGLRLYTGTADDFSPMLPWMIMNIQYQIFWKIIHPMPCGHSLQKYKSRWHECYNKFNHSLLCVFSDVEKAEIAEKMGEFEDYMDYHVTVAKMQFMNRVSFYPVDMQDVIASCMMCNVLAQNAQIVYGRVFKTGRLKSKTNRDIEGVEKNSHMFVNILHGMFSDQKVTFMDDKNINDAVLILQKRIVKWLQEQ